MKKYLFLGGFAVILVLAATVALLSGGDSSESDKDLARRSLRIRTVDQRGRNRLSAEKSKLVRKGDRGKSSKTALAIREKPSLRLDDAEDAKLSALAKSILKDLQDALDSDDFKRISTILARMQSLMARGKFSDIPVSIRLKAVEALGWFGAKGVPEMVGFLADADPEVVQMSIEQIENALDDITLSDRERSEIISIASKYITDDDALEYIFMNINDMRPSVGIGTLVDICENGNEQSRAKMPDAIEFFTGDGEIRTVEDAERWLEENPDPEGADEQWGGWKEE